MIKLKCEKKVVIKCEYYDLEEVIKHIYGHDYEIMPMEEVGSSQYSATYDINVEEKVLTEDEVRKITSLWNGKPNQFILRVILNDLCNHDIIEAGEYIIGVSW